MARRRPALSLFTPVIPAGAPAAADPPVVWGYARVSTDDQTTEPQVIALAAGGINPGRIIVETISGAVAATARPSLAGLLSVLRPSDTLTAVRIDRIGRDPADVLALARDLTTRGIRLRFLDLGAETGTPAGDLILTVLAGVAGWERAILRARTREGLTAARQRGQALGRRQVLSPIQKAHAAELAASGHSVREVARRLGCGPSVAHRAIMEACPL